jgi:hypothetical protein
MGWQEGHCGKEKGVSWDQRLKGRMAGGQFGKKEKILSHVNHSEKML